MFKSAAFVLVEETTTGTLILVRDNPPAGSTLSFGPFQGSLKTAAGLWGVGGGGYLLVTAAAEMWEAQGMFWLHLRWESHVTRHSYVAMN